MDDRTDDKMKFTCPHSWDWATLEPIAGGEDGEKVRFCAQCNKNVYWCSSEQQLKKHGMLGNCVAFNRNELDVERSSKELEVPWHEYDTLGLPIPEPPIPEPPKQSRKFLLRVFIPLLVCGGIGFYLLYTWLGVPFFYALLAAAGLATIALIVVFREKALSGNLWFLRPNDPWKEDANDMEDAGDFDNWDDDEPGRPLIKPNSDP